jgi:iron complex outermembrane receptor protein
VIVAAALAASAANAQNAPAAPPPAIATGANGASTQVGEVVVTAQRRSESISKVPVAISALDSNKLRENTVTRESDLQSLVPGLTVKATGSQNQLNYTIRGQTLDAFSGSSPGVLAYVNDVAQSSQTASSLYDLSSVQVLKGPQGTLFGRNATGGAVLYNTTMPGDAFGGYATFRYAAYDLLQFQGAVDAPLAPGLLTVRLAADIRKQQGFVENLRDGTHLGDTDAKSGRVTVKFTPTDKFKDITVFQYGAYGGTNLVGELQSVNKVGSTYNGQPLNATGDAIYGAALENYVARQQALGPDKVDLVYTSPPFLSNTRYLENTAEYTVSPNLQFKNIVSLSNSHTRTTEILSGSPFGVIDLLTPAHVGTYFGISQWSEEAQVLGHALSGNLKYIVGVYAASEKDTDVVPVTVGFGLPTPLAAFNYNYNDTDDTKAVYAQGTYDLSSLTSVHGLSFTAGYRYTWEDLRLDQTPGSIFYGMPTQTMSESKPSWQLGLQYQMNNHLLLYVVSRGSWRAGNFNGTTTPVNDQNQFNAETTWDVELGTKFNGEILGRSTRLNFDIYQQTIENVQRDVYFNINNTPASFTHNVPQARVRGVEGDVEVRLLDWLTVGGNFAYTDAVYTRPTVALFGQNITFGDYQDTPKYTGSAFVTLTLPTPAEWGPMTLHADAYGQSHTWYSSLAFSIDPGTSLPGYGLVNLRYDWRKIMGSSVSLGAFVRNLTDTTYYVGGYALGADVGINTRIPGSPRMWGLDLNYAF